MACAAAQLRSADRREDGGGIAAGISGAVRFLPRADSTSSALASRIGGSDRLEHGWKPAVQIDLEQPIAAHKPAATADSPL